MPNMTPNDLLTKKDLIEMEANLVALINDKNTLNLPLVKETDCLLTRDKLLGFLDISENTFKEHLDGKIPEIIIGKRIRYDKEDVLEYLKNLSHSRINY